MNGGCGMVTWLHYFTPVVPNQWFGDHIWRAVLCCVARLRIIGMKIYINADISYLPNITSLDDIILVSNSDQQIWANSWFLISLHLPYITFFEFKVAPNHYSKLNTAHKVQNEDLIHYITVNQMGNTATERLHLHFSFSVKSKKLKLALPFSKDVVHLLVYWGWSVHTFHFFCSPYIFWYSSNRAH